MTWELNRLQYEDLGLREYWVVDVQASQIYAFSVEIDRSTRRLQESQVLPGLKLEILEQALQRSRQEPQSDHRLAHDPVLKIILFLSSIFHSILRNEAIS